jgi:hypothetical protein
MKAARAIERAIIDLEGSDGISSRVAKVKKWPEQNEG